MENSLEFASFPRGGGSALLDVGHFVCFDCVQDWWQHHAPSLALEERHAAERKLLRWLVSHHNAKVISHAGKMPRPEEMELKIMAACEQCDGTGKAYGSHECRHCEGRGSVWVVGLKPESQ